MMSALGNESLKKSSAAVLIRSLSLAAAICSEHPFHLRRVERNTFEVRVVLRHFDRLPTACGSGMISNFTSNKSLAAFVMSFSREYCHNDTFACCDESEHRHGKSQFNFDQTDRGGTGRSSNARKRAFKGRNGPANAHKPCCRQQTTRSRQSGG